MWWLQLQFDRAMIIRRPKLRPHVGIESRLLLLLLFLFLFFNPR